jgi:hypothetical protein
VQRYNFLDILPIWQAHGNFTYLGKPVKSVNSMASWHIAVGFFIAKL